MNTTTLDLILTDLRELRPDVMNCARKFSSLETDMEHLQGNGQPRNFRKMELSQNILLDNADSARASCPLTD